jgi:hypothetical protein
MEIRSASELTVTITLTAEVTLPELMKEGPALFAKRVRELLEAELKSLLTLTRAAEMPSSQLTALNSAGGR